MDLDHEFESRFVCPKCTGRGARVKRIATSGSGLSRLFNLQHNRFVAVSCNRCGYTELYNPEILEGKNTGMDVLDFLFGS